MRVLCLKSSSLISNSWADLFVRWSPQVEARGEFLFLEVSSTANLFGGEEKLIQKAFHLLEESSRGTVSAAISDHAATAQAAACFYQQQVIPSGRDRDFLGLLPIQSLFSLEGQKAWEHPETIQEMIEAFRRLGFRFLADIQGFSVHDFTQRWGKVGRLVWRRLQAKDHQVISPRVVPDPFYSYRYFEHAVSYLPQLEGAFEDCLKRDFAHLSSKARFAKKITVLLHTEFSKFRHEVTLEPAQPSRDAGLFVSLFHQKCVQLDLLNPIQEMEILISDVSEKVEQFSFFDQQTPQKDRWDRLLSFAQMLNIKIGFLERKSGFFPEDRWQMTSSEVRHFVAQDQVLSFEGALQIKPTYGAEFFKGPRPALLLKNPKIIPETEVSHWTKKTQLPLERFIGTWWHHMDIPGRDYFIAQNKTGAMGWIFKDRLSEQHFLHGLFD